MNRNQLQEKLLPKEHHKETKYLKWYLNIIEKANYQNRKKLNKISEDYIYYENHHILPKAKGLFEKYSNLKDYKWNSVLLTAKEHFIVHLCIWKHYKSIKYTNGEIKMSRAVKRMQTSNEYNSKQYKYFRLNLSCSEETKTKISRANSGRKHSEKTKEKIREIRKLQTFSDETRIKMSNAQKGRKHSKESKKKMSISKKGQLCSEETKMKLSIINKGIKQKVITCPHCGKEGGNIMYRYHFDNCKFK